MPEPTIYVERCPGCPMHKRLNKDEMWCEAIEEKRMGPWDRRFPRWCPLLKAPITVAAIESLDRQAKKEPKDGSGG